MGRKHGPMHQLIVGVLAIAKRSQFRAHIHHYFFQNRQIVEGAAIAGQATVTDNGENSQS